MRIQKYFYSDAMKDQEKIEAELQLEKSLLTEEEKQERKEKSERMFLDLMERIMRKEKELRIVNKEKLELFCLMEKLALAVAENACLNLETNIDKKRGGNIIFRTELFTLIPNEYDGGSTKGMAKLIENADEVLIEDKDGMMQMSLFYKIYE